uniref:Transmembrane protein n=1 Tax=Panagrellus redivivus TaxID=6233 RepID=A0A7E4V6U7_PANRE
MRPCDNFTQAELRMVRQRNHCCCGVIEARDGALIISILWTLSILGLAVVSQSLYAFLLLAIPCSAFIGYFYEIHQLYLPVIMLQMLTTAVNVTVLFLVVVAEISVSLQDDILRLLRLHQVVAVPAIAGLTVLTLFHVWLTMTLAAAYRSVRDTRLLVLERYAQAPAMDDCDDFYFRPIIMQV